MAKVRVPIHRTTPTQSVLINPAATEGAQIGTNLLMPDGSLATPTKLAALFGAGTATTSSSITTTDDLDEGQWNQWFTALRAQNAVGGILTDTGTISFDYVAGVTIAATLKDLADSGTGAALVKITRDSKGRISGTSDASTDDLAEGDDHLYFTEERAAAAAPIKSIVQGSGVTVDTADPENPVISATGGGTGGAGTVPFFLANQVRANINLNADSELPFFLADGTASDIPLAA
jgi:hypothetical protein